MNDLKKDTEELAKKFIDSSTKLKDAYNTLLKRPLMGLYIVKYRKEDFIDSIKSIANSIIQNCNFEILCEIKSITEFVDSYIGQKLDKSKYRFIIQNFFADSYNVDNTNLIACQEITFYCYNKASNKELSVSISISDKSSTSIQFCSYTKRRDIKIEYIRYISTSLQEKINESVNIEFKEDMMFMIECLSEYIIELGVETIKYIEEEYKEKRKKGKK